LLLDTNPEIAHLLVAAHVFGHVDFFINNLCCADTHRRMVHNAVAQALRIDPYIERDGLRPWSTSWTSAVWGIKQ